MGEPRWFTDLRSEYAAIQMAAQQIQDWILTMKASTQITLPSLFVDMLPGAAERCPSLKKKRVSPHVLRHSTAMELLQAGIDRAVIALWLGHETLNTVQEYFHANLKLKEDALAKTAPLGTKT